MPDDARSSVRLPAPERITGIEADEIRDELREFAHLGGFTMRQGQTPWFGAALRTPEDAREAWQLAAQLSSYDLPRLMDRQARSSAALGLRPPASYAEAVAQDGPVRGDQPDHRGQLDRAVYAADPQALADAVAGNSSASLGERRRLKKEAQRLYLRPGEAGPRGAGRVARGGRRGSSPTGPAPGPLTDTGAADAGQLPAVPGRSC